MVSGGALTKKRPSDVPLFLVDPDLARDDLMVLPVRVGDISKPCLVLEAYCTLPRCTCRSAFLWFVELPARTGSEAATPSPDPDALLRVMEDTWYGGSPFLDLAFDLKAQVFSVEEKERIDGVLSRAATELARQLTSEHVKLLRQHRERVRAWGKENPWHQKDWADFSLETCVSWLTVHPSAPLLTAFHEGRHFIFHDMYCAKPACRCDEVLLGVVPSRGKAGSASPLGLFRVSLASEDEGQVTITEGDPATVRGNFAELLGSRPGVLGLFRRRKQAMRDFGRFVEARNGREEAPFPVAARDPFFRREAQELPTRSGLDAPLRRGMVPRNAPCPCGSGRKFKNCCGA